MTTIDPEQLFSTFMTTARPQKRKNLEILHQVCCELNRLGSRNFSLATVGRMSEERGGISCKALYNSTSDDYKALIQAWSSLSKGASISPSKSAQDPLGSNDLLRKIADPALRALIGYIIAERDRLRGEVKLLRANTSVVIDRRVLPGHINITPQGQVVQVMSSAGLTDTEKQALSQAISSEFLIQEGWTEGENGGIFNSRGRKLFDIGFTHAIRKSLLS